MKDIMLSVRFRTLRFMGISGVIGLLLLAVAGLTGYWLIPQTKAQSAVLQQVLGTAKESAVQAIEQRRSAPTSTSELQTFSDWLPPLSSNANDVQKLFTLARESDIELSKADYQFTTEPGARFARYQVTVPLKSRYFTVLRFATGALNALPHLALDEVQFARPQVSTDVVEAQLRFTFFYRP